MYQSSLKQIAHLSEEELLFSGYINDYINNYNPYNVQDHSGLVGFLKKSCCPQYQEENIRKIVEKLEEMHIFAKDSTLSLDQVHKHPVRSKILAYIQKNPGVYNRKIRREVEIGSNSLNWHLKVLKIFQLIKEEKFHDNSREIGYFENHSYMDHEYDLFSNAKRTCYPNFKWVTWKKSFHFN